MYTKSYSYVVSCTIEQLVNTIFWNIRMNRTRPETHSIYTVVCYCTSPYAHSVCWTTKHRVNSILETIRINRTGPGTHRIYTVVYCLTSPYPRSNNSIAGFYPLDTQTIFNILDVDVKSSLGTWQKRLNYSSGGQFVTPRKDNISRTMNCPVLEQQRYVLWPSTLVGH